MSLLGMIPPSGPQSTSSPAPDTPVARTVNGRWSASRWLTSSQDVASFSLANAGRSTRYRFATAVRVASSCLATASRHACRSSAAVARAALRRSSVAATSASCSCSRRTVAAASAVSCLSAGLFFLPRSCRKSELALRGGSLYLLNCPRERGSARRGSQLLALHSPARCLPRCWAAVSCGRFASASAAGLSLAAASRR